MDLLDCQLLVIFNDVKNYSIVGKRLGLTQTAITRRIEKLENHFNCDLVQKPIGRGLTQDGFMVLGYAHHQLQEYETLRNRIANSKRYHHLRIMANASIAITDFVNVYDVMLDTHPYITVTRIDGNAKAMISELQNGNIDAGVFIGRQDIPGLRFTTYRTERFCFVTPISHALAHKKNIPFKDALKFPMVGFLSKTLNAYLDNVAKKNNLELNYRVATSSIEEQLNIIARTDIGIGIVPISIAQRYMQTYQNIAIIDVENEFDEIEICFVTHKGQMSEACSIFLRLLITQFRK